MEWKRGKKEQKTLFGDCVHHLQQTDYSIIMNNRINANPINSSAVNSLLLSLYKQNVHTIYIKLKLTQHCTKHRPLVPLHNHNKTCINCATKRSMISLEAIIPYLINFFTNYLTLLSQKELKVLNYIYHAAGKNNFH